MQASGKTIAVTGGGNGIGRELVLNLLGRGARVAAIDISEGGLAETAQLAGDKADRLSTHVADITDRVTVEALPSAIMEKHGQVDGVFHLIEPTPAAWHPEDVATRLPPLPTGIGVAAEFARRRRCRLLLVVAAGEDYEDPFDAAAGTELAGIDTDDDDVRVARLFHAYGPRMEPEDEGDPFVTLERELHEEWRDHSVAREVSHYVKGHHPTSFTLQSSGGSNDSYIYCFHVFFAIATKQMFMDWFTRLEGSGFNEGRLEVLERGAVEHFIADPKKQRLFLGNQHLVLEYYFQHNEILRYLPALTSPV